MTSHSKFVTIRQNGVTPMILTKYVLTSVVPNNILYLKKLGYSNIEIGQKLKIPVSELKSGSNINVACRCDVCSKKYIQRFSRNKSVCSDCSVRNRMKGNVFGCNNKKHQIPDRSELQKFLEDVGKAGISQHYKVSIPTVNRWLKHHQIEIVPYYGLIHDIPEDFHNSVLSEKCPTIAELSKKYQVSYPTIKRWIRKLDLPFVGVTVAKDIPEKQALVDLNVKQKLKSSDIAALYKVSESVVVKWFRHHALGIKQHGVGSSIAEKQVLNFLNEELGCSFQSSKGLLSNKRYQLDGYDKNLNIAFEYCGLYWHSSSNSSDKHKHQNKFVECQTLGIKLITIFESDWLHKQDIVKSMLRARVGKGCQRIFARKTVVKELLESTASDFFECNHVSGHVKSLFYYGLFIDNRLIAAISMKKSRYDKGVQYELIRFATELNTVVVGGFQKLFGHFVKKNSPISIISYADLRFGEGKVYEKAGFRFVHRTVPNYYYFKERITKLLSRQQFQKHKLSQKLDNFDPTKTEFENMTDNGYYRIYDCGHNKWIWKSTAN